MIHQVDRNKRLLLLAFQQGLLQNLSSRDFQNSPPFEISACFYATITRNFERFQYCKFDTSFQRIENLFQKTGVLFLS